MCTSGMVQKCKALGQNYNLTSAKENKILNLKCFARCLNWLLHLLPFLSLLFLLTPPPPKKKKKNTPTLPCSQSDLLRLFPKLSYSWICISHISFGRLSHVAKGLLYYMSSSRLHTPGSAQKGSIYFFFPFSA
jgi:hypothetical protein